MFASRLFVILLFFVVGQVVTLQLKQTGPISRNVNLLSRLNRAVEEKMPETADVIDDFSGDHRECVIEVPVKIKGKCVRLLGGTTACQTSEYLQPLDGFCSQSDNNQT